MDKKLYRSKKDRKLGGVCGGIAEWLNVDSTIIRIAFIFSAVWGGAGIIAYLLIYLIMPENEVE